MNLNYDDRFIFGAFRWEKTEQGRDVWSIRNKEFRKWYNSNDRPMSWKEYCAQNPINAGDCYIDETCSIDFVITASSKVDRNADTDVNVMSKDLCEAFIAYMKLIQLRNAWVKDCDAEDYTYKVEAKDGRSPVYYQAEI